MGNGRRLRWVKRAAIAFALLVVLTLSAAMAFRAHNLSRHARALAKAEAMGYPATAEALMAQFAQQGDARDIIPRLIEAAEALDAVVSEMEKPIHDGHHPRKDYAELRLRYGLPFVGQGEHYRGGESLDEHDAEKMRAYLVKAADVSRIVRELADMPDPVCAPSILENGMPNLDPINNLFQISAHLCLEQYLALYDGEPDVFIECVQLRLAHVNALAGVPDLLAQLVRDNLLRNGIKDVEYGVASGILESQHLRKLCRMYENMKIASDMERVIASGAMRLSLFDVRILDGTFSVESYYVSNVLGDATYEKLTPTGKSTLARLAGALALVEGAAAFTLEESIELIETCAMPPERRAAERAKLDQRVEATPRWRLGYGASTLQTYTRVLRDAESIEAECAYLTAQWAIRAFEGDNNGRLPQSLNELTPDYLSAVPSDSAGNALLLYVPKGKEGDYLLDYAMSGDAQPTETAP